MCSSAQHNLSHGWRCEYTPTIHNIIENKTSERSVAKKKHNTRTLSEQTGKYGMYLILCFFNIFCRCEIREESNFFSTTVVFVYSVNFFVHAFFRFWLSFFFVLPPLYVFYPFDSRFRAFRCCCFFSYIAVRRES